MRMADLIEKKKQGAALTNTEISEIISGYVNGAIPDYQMSALLMAICFRGMNSEGNPFAHHGHHPLRPHRRI